MKSRFAKMTAAAMAVTMCLPMAASAAQEGSFETSFDVYSPVLTISVPTKLDVKVNPIADSNATDVGKFAVASNSIDIMNASVDVEKDQAIPVNVTVKASVESAAEDVVTAYNTITEDVKSTKKKIYLELTQAGTAATMKLKKKADGTADEDAAFVEKKLDLTKYEVNASASYVTPAKSVPITKYGSLLSVDIAGPVTTDTTAGAKFSTDATKVTAGVGSFAVTGAANTNADWKTTDVKVAVTYNVKASKTLNITNPAVAEVNATISTSAADCPIVVPDVGESKVVAFAVHNDEAGYKDYVWTELEQSKYKIEYAPNATTTTQTDATITILKDDPGLVFLADEANGCKGKAQDLIIALSDGRYVVTTLTVN